MFFTFLYSFLLAEKKKRPDKTGVFVRLPVLCNGLAGASCECHCCIETSRQLSGIHQFYFLTKSTVNMWSSYLCVVEVFLPLYRFPLLFASCCKCDWSPDCCWPGSHDKEPSAVTSLNEEPGKERYRGNLFNSKGQGEDLLCFVFASELCGLWKHRNTYFFKCRYITSCYCYQQENWLFVSLETTFLIM